MPIYSDTPPRHAQRGVVVDDRPQKTERQNRVLKQKIERKRRQLQNVKLELAMLQGELGASANERRNQLSAPRSG